MTNLLYCVNGQVLAWHDSSQNIQASTYGAGVSIIPWPLPMGALAKVGSPPPAGQPDTRPYAAPTLSGATQLAAYASTKQALIMNGGISVNVGTVGSPVNVEASTDPASLVLLQGAYTMAQANSSATFNWVESTGASITLTAAQITTIFNAVTAFLQATFTTLSQVLTAIAGNTITTQAGVDTPPSPIPAWPVNS